jgi:hypothetical protein
MIRALLLGRIEWTDSHQCAVIAGLIACVFAGAALLWVMG